MSKGKLKMFAHRGLSSKAPENSLLAINSAIGSNAAGLEFDVELTRDKQAIVIHQESFSPNETFDSLVLSPANERNSWVSEYALSELMQLDAGNWFSPQTKGMKLCSLKEVLSLDWKGKTALMELKDPLSWDSDNRTPHQTDLVTAVKDQVQSFRLMGNNIVILSFSAVLLEICHEEIPEVKLALNISESERLNSALSKDLQHISIIVISETLALSDPQIIEHIHQKDKQAYVYEHTNYQPQPDLAKVLADRRIIWEKLRTSGADGVISNYSEYYSQE